MSCRHRADNVPLFPFFFKEGVKGGKVFLSQEKDEAYAEIEDGAHLVLPYAPFRQKGEDPRPGPGVVLQGKGEPFGDHPDDVVVEPSSGDVGHGMDQPRGVGLQRQGDVEFRGGEQAVPEGLSAEKGRTVVQFQGGVGGRPIEEALRTDRLRGLGQPRSGGTQEGG